MFRGKTTFFWKNNVFIISSLYIGRETLGLLSFFSFFFGKREKSFPPVVDIFRPGYQNYVQRVHKRNGRKTFFWKNFSHHLLTFIRKTVTIWQMFFCQRCLYNILLVQKNFKGVFLKTFPGNFRTVDEQNSTSTSFYQRCLQKHILQVHRNNLRRNNSFENKFVFFVVFECWTLFSDLFAKFFCRSCQNWLSGVHRTTSKKNSFSENL